MLAEPGASRLHPPDDHQGAAVAPEHHAFAGRRHDASERGDVHLVDDDDQRVRTAPAEQDAPGPRRARRPFLAVGEERVERRLGLGEAGEGEVGRLRGPAPPRGQDRADGDALGAERLADAPRLGTAGFVEIALRGAVAEPQSSGIAGVRTAPNPRPGRDPPTLLSEPCVDGLVDARAI